MLLLGAWTGAARAEEALAFVTEVKGAASIARAGGAREAAAMGSQLCAGDELSVTQGTAVLIYLSGRSVTVAKGQSHKVQKGEGRSSTLMGRVMDTLGEIAGPQGEAERPVVHGMARDLAGLTGALPANTVLSHPDFAFSWDWLEGVEEYEFTLESAKGEVLERRTVKGTQLPASELPLKPGKRYVWSVQETGTLLPRSSGKSWVKIATEAETAELRKTLQEIEKAYAGETRDLLQATNLYREGFYYEVERILVARQRQQPLSGIEGKMLMLSYVKMERWDRLPRPEEKAEPVKDEE